MTEENHPAEQSVVLERSRRAGFIEGQGKAAAR
jgi:hypothetical protein